MVSEADYHWTEVSDKVSDQQEANSQGKISGEGEAIVIEGHAKILKREDDDRKKDDNEYKQRQLRFNKWLTIFTACLVLTGVVSIFIYLYQSRTARISADAAQESAAAANNAARITGNALLSSKQSAKDTLGEMQKQSKAMQDVAAATKEAFHVSERAYIRVAEAPPFDMEKGVATLFVTNTGRKPSGAVEIIDHELTMDFGTAISAAQIPIASFMSVEGVIQEFQWRRFDIASVPPYPIRESIIIPIPAFSKANMEARREIIVISGTIKYNDGFHDDPPDESPFCWEAFYYAILKEPSWTACDPRLITPQMEQIDGYPKSKERP